MHPLSAIVTFRFPAREGLPPLKLTWYEGTRPPRPDDLEDGRRVPEEGGIFIKGSQGTIMAGVYGESPRIIPEKRMKEVKLPPKTLPRVKGTHEQDWVRACKTGTPAGADFAYSGPLTETCLLGNIAKRIDSRIVWDAENLKITNLPDANQWVHTRISPGLGTVETIMNSHDRILAVLEGRPVDRLPRMPITMMFAADVARRSLRPLCDRLSHDGRSTTSHRGGLRFRLRFLHLRPGPRGRRLRGDRAVLRRPAAGDRRDRGPLGRQDECWRG